MTRADLTPDRPVLGVMLMLGFCILVPVADAIAKVLGAYLSVGMLIVARFGVQALLLGPLVLLTGRMWRMRGRVLRLTAARTILHIIGMVAMFTALQYLPLAETVAIAFVMPFIMLLLGYLVLNEEVGPRRLAACAVGFVGTLMVIQPSFADVGWPALWPVLVAVVFALFMLITRQIAKETDPVGLQAVSGVMATGIVVPALLIGDAMGFAPLAIVPPSGFDATLLVVMGLVGTAAHLLMTWSLRYAPSATLAPMQYLEIPFATIIGWLVFRDLPNGLAALGICVTIAAGLYIVMREQAMSRRATAPGPPRTAMPPATGPEVPAHRHRG